MKHELLIPVGNMEALEAAIHNGADAVYLGGKKFGARAFANNFSLEELEQAVKLCHLFGVKIYVTVNTLVYDEEIAEALEYIAKLHQFGVDALIMQDVGLINLVHQTFPNLEIHASTQMHNHSEESLAFLEKLGIKRVVFARELSLDYINGIKTNLEKEVFIHGSLCISYSGQCLFSSQILNRSGNRGECAGMCRLPYKLYEDKKELKTDGDYILSPKDLCAIPYFQKLMESNIKCFKVEGRMKSPLYVAVVTRIYRHLIDQYENNKPLKVNEDDFNLLKAIFNRGYTEGYLNNAHDIMNISSPNHIGLKIGDVIKTTNKKIAIKLTHDLKQFSGIRFKNSQLGLTVNYIYNEKDELINKGLKGTIIYLDNFINLKDNDEVMLTKPISNIYPYGYKKILIDMQVIAKANEKLILKVQDDTNEIVLKSDNILEKAMTSPISEERVKEALMQTSNYPFAINKIEINLDPNIFIPISILKDLRRKILEKLKLVRETKKGVYTQKEYHREFKKQKVTQELSVLVRTKEQLQACLDLNIKNIIVENKNLWKDNLIYKVPRNNIKHEYNYNNLLVTDYASMLKYPNYAGDYYLNVTNHYTLDYLSNYVKKQTLSVECSKEHLSQLMQYYDNNINAEVLIYGRIELMLMKYCPLNKLVKYEGKCQVCQNKHQYYLKDRNNAFYPILNNPLNHSTTILNYKKTNLIKDIPTLKKMGINNFRLEFFDENYDEVKKIIERVEKENE